MPLSLWGMLYSVPYNLIAVWTMIRMIPMRRPVCFFLLWQILCLPIYLLSRESTLGWLRPIITVLLWLTLVLLFAQKRSLHAVLAAILISLLSVVAEVVGAMLSMLLLGKPVDAAMAGSEPLLMLEIQVIFWVIMMLMCWELLRIWQRSVRSQEEIHLWRFVLVPVGQYFLVAFCGIFSLRQHAPLGSYLLLGVLASCCALADILLFRVLRQYTAQQLARQRADLLEEQLRQQLEYYHGIMERIEQTARLRHDLRNQLQTVYTLMERGQYDAAAELLVAFSAPLAAKEEYCDE